MKKLLQILFLGIFVFMIAMTIWTSMQMSIWDAWPTYKANPWAISTLYDAYFGFLTFFIWVYFKETSLASKAVWFLLIMLLGNIAMSFYVLLQLNKLEPGAPVSRILVA